MPFDFAKLIEMAPFLMGAFRGPSPEGNAMLEGYIKGQHRKQTLAEQERERQRQDLMDALTRQQQQFSQANTLADNRRADRGLDIQQEAAGLTRQSANLGKMKTLQEMAGDRAGQLADVPGIDPSQAQHQLYADVMRTAEAGGVPSATAAGVTLPSMAPLIAERDKKHYREQLEKAEKSPIYAGLVGTPEFEEMTVKDRKGNLIKVKDLRSAIGDQLTDASGAPVTPKLKGAPVTAGSESERAAELLGKIRDATDPDAKAKFQRQYDDLIAAKKALGQADDKAGTGPRARFNIQPITNPDGTTGLVRINMETGETTPVDLPEGAGSGRADATMRLSKAYLDRTVASGKTATSFESKLTSLGKQFDVQFPNLLKSPEGQQYKQAEDEFINAALRRESGAAIQQSEYDRFEKIYFVRPGDTPANIKQKQDARERVIKGFRVAAGSLAGKEDASVDTAPKKQVRYGLDGKPLP